MNLNNNMVFEIKSGFMPNLSNSDTLKIIESKQGSVIIQMNNSKCRGVFPLDNFQYWIRKGVLIPINGGQKEKTS
ncbi:hypothetical protein D0469_13540 [Peribacillus saganii]|uniref:Uncharacterized protein n=1 Tax=Peribacillus saganii TaxID=2303992 RepID=A0A372LMY7_9BACI|nr:hypothetical protein [Peribacillus saganii]RFU67869.1 hypothetical protein D0469_13540 [Peribacillus saganii]